MSQQAAVKIEYESGEIYFYPDEVLDILITPLKHFLVQTGDHNLPNIISDGSSWRVLQMRIRQTRSDTRSRIKAVLDEKNVLTVFYALLEDPSASVNVFLIPDSSEFRYFNGEQAANVDFQITFLECE